MKSAPINHAMAVRCSSDYLTEQVQNLVSLGHFKSKPVAHTQDLTSSISVAVRLDNCSNIYIPITVSLFSTSILFAELLSFSVSNY